MAPYKLSYYYYYYYYYIESLCNATSLKRRWLSTDHLWQLMTSKIFITSTRWSSDILGGTGNFSFRFPSTKMISWPFLGGACIDVDSRDDWSCVISILQHTLVCHGGEQLPPTGSGLNPDVHINPMRSVNAKSKVTYVATSWKSNYKHDYMRN